MTLGESINLKETLVKKTVDTVGAPNFHERTGHTLPPEKSEVFKKLEETLESSKSCGMVLNPQKTKLMLFNPCRSIDFMPEFVLDKNQLEVVDEWKLLGVILRSDLKWSSKTEFIVKKAASKLWILRRLKELGAN